MLGKIIGIALIVLVVASLCYGISVYESMLSNTYEIKGTVVKTWIDPVDGGSAYLVKVKLEDGTLKMLEVQRNYHFLHVNEDLLFTSIETNKTYIFKCWGWDMEYYWIFSVYWYPNVIAIQEVS